MIAVHRWSLEAVTAIPIHFMHTNADKGAAVGHEGGKTRE